MRNKSTSLINILSPWFLSLAITFAGICFTLIPQQSYEYFVGERDYMLSSWKTRLWLLLTGVVFSAFAYITYLFFDKWTDDRYDKVKTSVLSYTAYLAIIISICLNLISLATLLQSVGADGILNTFSSGGGSDLKSQINDVMASSSTKWAINLTLPFMVYGFWGYLNTRKAKWTLALLMSFALYIAATLGTLSRGTLTATLVMLSSVLFIYKFRSNQVNLAKLFIWIAAFFAAIIFLFAIVDLARKDSPTSGNNAVIRSLYGYFPASYNRLTLILDDKLRMPNSNSGYYTMQGLYDLTLFAKIFDFSEIARSYGLNIPKSGFDNWMDQFAAVDSSGLNRNLIWATVPGYAYADYGKFSIIWFALVGIWSGWLWGLFKKTAFLGICLYPPAIYFIISWTSLPSLSQNSFNLYILGTFIVWLGIRFFTEHGMIVIRKSQVGARTR